MKRTVAVLSVAVVGILLVTTISAAATVTVHPGDMQGWAFAHETPTGSGAMVAGPATPPLGTGSANLIVDSTGGEILAKAGYTGLKLADIDTLEYSTYRASGSPALAIALQFNIDNDVTDADDAFKGRLIYEPYYTQSVVTGAWQTWNTLNDAAGTATGNWWFSNAGLAATSGCTIANPCTWAEVLAAFPNAGVHNTAGAVVLKAGGGWAGGFDGNVDALTINDETYDFELSGPADTPTATASETLTATDTATPTDTPTSTSTSAPSDTPTSTSTSVPSDTPTSTSTAGPIDTATFTPTAGPTSAVPTNKDQCKKGGWMTLTRADGSRFKNQGDCIQYVNTGK
jgi:hypothetical protein